MKSVLIATYQERSKELSLLLKRRKESVVVRLGGTLRYPEHEIQINDFQSVKNSIYKDVQKELLLDNNIKVLPTLNAPKYPCVLKGVVRSCGKAVKLVKNKRDFEKYSKQLIDKNKGYLIEPLFNTTSEYRLHCTRDKVFFAVKKIKENDDLFINNKNHYNVKDFVKPRLWKEIQKECLKAMKALNLDIACFDVLYSSKGDHTFVIAEANTNPEMLKNTLHEYAKVLEELIDAAIKNKKVIPNNKEIEKYLKEINTLKITNKQLVDENKKYKELIKNFIANVQNI